MDNPLALEIPQPISEFTEEVLVLERRFTTVNFHTSLDHSTVLGHWNLTIRIIPPSTP
jgi:hypothetical protein